MTDSYICDATRRPIGRHRCALASVRTDLMIAGGVESMSRAPFVMPKAESAFSRSNTIHDTTIGGRFVNCLDIMPCVPMCIGVGQGIAMMLERA